MQDGTAQLRIRRLSNFAANGLPVGFEYFTINKNIRTGSLPLLGGLYSRELYADLWSWVQEQPGYLITETEWQSKSQANNGNVPFYSGGDGSTTFRVPSLKCWVKSCSEITEVGSYLAAGLPNINLTIPGLRFFVGAEGENGSAFDPPNVQPPVSVGKNLRTSNDGNGLGYTQARDVTINMQTANQIYGNSDEVTPESIVGIWCVIAFGTISNTGNLDVQTLYNKIIELEGRLENADSTPTGTILALLDDEVPEGYLPAEGAAISRTTYADLFNIIGTKFGEGDGSTTFNLPNLVGKFLEGDGTPGTLKEPGLPNITGTDSKQWSWAGNSTKAGAFVPRRGQTAGGTPTGSSETAFFDFDASKSNSIYGASDTVQPSALTVKFIIKY